jgi:predicted O-linked N-acetylglucosamine transferase (SPINDLY family)
VELSRVRFEGRSPHYEFLAAYGGVDIALDPFPYNGGTTTTEAIWQGVPVVCFDGDRWAARQGASLLRTAGLGEFVAEDAAGYVELAVRLANDPETPGRLAELRRGMRARLKGSAVCDTARFAREMEELYLRFAGQGRETVE